MKKHLTLLLTLLLAIPISVSASLSESLAGKILLQVEENGEAWYVNPDSGQRYFMGRPTDAFSLMRSLGLGITTDDLLKIPRSIDDHEGNEEFRKNLSGKILLQVEENGEAWYVNPDNLKRYFLGRPEDAFRIMRQLGLGISNSNLDTISVSQDSAPLPQTESTPADLPTNDSSDQEATMPADMETASYKVEFIATWSEETHPNDYISSAHFSPFVVYSHNGTESARIFTPGQISSPGMEDMAETGATGALNTEIDALIAADQALSRSQGGRIDSPGQTMANLDLNLNNSHFTLVSMIAPSPDWFIGQSGNLYVDGEWVESLELEVLTYDAGTDSGPELTSPNNDTNPKEGIAMFADNLQKMGKIVLTRIDG